MKFLDLSKEELEIVLTECSKNELITFFDYIYDLFDLQEMMRIPTRLKDKKLHKQTTKSVFIDFFIKILTDDFKARINEKLTKTALSKFLYQELVWKRTFVFSDEAKDKFDLNLQKLKKNYYHYTHQRLTGNLSLIVRQVYQGYAGEIESDILWIDENIKSLLRAVTPMPEDFYLLPQKDLNETDFTYNNEDGVLEFISVISQMLENGLIEFGKTTEKPLIKTLNILKSSTQVSEFFSDKGIDTLAVDMLTRSFYFYSFWKKFKNKEIETLKSFTKLQLNNELRFFISRIFTSHLKRVRFDEYYTSQQELFDLVKVIIDDMPKDDWVLFENIINYCKYRSYRFDFESDYKTDGYYMECDVFRDDGKIGQDELYAKNYYDMIFFHPVLKAMFFYLGSLGLLELKYDRPVSEYVVSAKGKPYISVWDGLEYVKLTKLGSYVFGFSKTYTQKELKVKKSKVKFDEYKPIITIDPQDSIMMAKLDSFCEKYDKNRYILSYNKIFKDCKNYKALELKIESFYKKVEKNPPKIFDDFFKDIKKSSNLLKRNLKQIVIELKNDKKLLELFMKDKKLKELIIKAEGYRVIVLKEDIPKLSKIVKSNGFFIEF